MGFRRYNPPPFEVMGRGPRTSSELPPAASHEPPGPVQPLTGLAALWHRTRHPVVLRVPAGYLFLMLLLLVGLMVLAFWTGRSIGYRDGFGYGQAKAESTIPLIIPGPAVQEARSAQTPTQALDLPVKRIDDPPVASDPRQQGLNYFILAHYRQEDAQRLLQFLWQQGVDAAAFRSHNARLFQVMALRGFAASEIGPTTDQYRQQLLALGRLWKQEYHGTDFSRNGIYLDKYTGKAVAAMIVQGDRK